MWDAIFINLMISKDKSSYLGDTTEKVRLKKGMEL
jgi:hypothetical protein